MEGATTGVQAQSMPPSASPWRLTWRVGAPAILLLVVLAVGLYAIRGDRGAMPDPGVRTAVAGDGQRAPTVREGLAAHLARNPGDGRAWVLLARAEFEADRYVEAAAAYGKAVAASPKVARDPAVWCEYADALGMVQGGSLAGPPLDLVTHALALNPSHPKALEMAGGAAFEARDYESAARYWRELLVQIPKATREHGELAAAIARADELAGRR
jgi:cytochrome c-type biogenesis protein CcmH/NrfG